MAILQNTTVSGSLVVTGDLTARQYILSSSVSYFTESFASGSTRFGDSLDDTMTVTGSLIMSSSLGVSLFISGSSGSVGIGTNSPATKLHVVGLTGGTRGGATSIPALGFTNSSSVALFTNNDTNYGTLFGTLNTGVGWVQQGRTDGTGTAYNLALQPSGGFVGIGVTAPNFTLHIDSNTSITRFQITNSTTGQGGSVGLQIIQSGNNTSITNRSSGYLSFETVGTERMRITGSSVGIGTILPTDFGAGYSSLSIDNAGAGGGVIDLMVGGVRSLTLAVDASSPQIAAKISGQDIRIMTNSGAGAAERMRITASGSVLIGRSTDANSSYKLQFDTPTPVWFNNGASYSAQFQIDSGGFYVRTQNNNGVLLAIGATSWSASTSDIRKKKNFEPTQGLAEILQIEPVKYHLLTDDDNDIKRLGFKAQNVQPLIPEMVHSNGQKAEDGSDYLTVTPDYILPVLVKAIQELSAKVTALETT